MGERLLWNWESERYLATRPDRYPGAASLRAEWCQEVLNDHYLAQIEPDLRSRINAGRYIGFSVSAGCVLVVIAYRDLDGRLHLINAWPASGRDMTNYREGTIHG